MTAKGYFEGLTAKLDVLELTGGSADGVKIGTVTVNFVDCETAEFRYSPDAPRADYRAFLLQFARPRCRRPSVRRLSGPGELARCCRSGC